MKIENVSIAKVIPYIRNPRKNDNAIEKVASSIQEFGFRQPIVVDEESVIIAGHTRYESAKRLGMNTVPVHVAKGLTPQQVKAYRIADNRVGQESEWDYDLLKLELDELKNPESTGFEDFEISDILKEINFEPSFESEQQRLDELDPKMVECPHCHKEFDVREQES